MKISFGSLAAPGLRRTLGLAGELAALICFTWLAVSGAWAQSDAETSRSGRDEPDRVVEAVEPARTTQLAGRLPEWVRVGRLADAPAPALQLDHLTVLLARSPGRERAFRQRLEDQQNPASPEYHRWLKPDEIGEQYGVTQHDLEAVEGWLGSRGLRVEQVSKSRTVVNFGGTVAQVEAAFAVKFQRYGLAATEAAAGTPRERLSISGRPRVPSALAPVVSAIGGLSQIPVHPYGHAEVRRMADKPQFNYCNQAGTCSHFILPTDFATIFDLKYPVIDNGESAPRIAIVGKSRFDPSDIQAFLSNAGVYASGGGANILIAPAGTDPGTTNDGAQLEATIDVTRALGTAPYAPVDLILSADAATQSGIFIAGLYEVDTVLDPVMNISFGACEADAGSDGVSLYDNLASQAAGEGISVFVSSGDAGAAGCDRNNATPPLTQVKSPNYICSTSYVTCVGGTEFNDTADPAQYWSSSNGYGSGSALGYIPEGGWNEPTFVNASGVAAFQASASGGGASSIIPKPSWQTGLGVPEDGFRDTPDVAFPSSAHDGYYACAAFIGGDCSQGYFAYVFGTSTAAPAMAAITATLDQQRSSSLGNLNPLLYATAADPSNGAFHDTTIESSGVTACSLATPSMCNNSTPSSTGLTGGLAGYQLAEGYDLVTGLGSLDGLKFNNAALPPLLTPIITFDPGSLQVATNQTFPLQASLTGSGPVPSGSVTWLIQNDYRYSFTAPLVNGVASMPAAQIPVAGQYQLYVVYSGDGSYATATSSASTTPSIVITAATGALSPTVLIAASPSSITYGQSAVFIATVQGSAATPTGSVQFLATGSLGSLGPMGPPVPLVNGSASSAPQLFVHDVSSAGIQAEYFGDAQYTGGLSPAAAFSVMSIPAPSFVITPADLSVKAGQTTGNTSTLTVASQNNYTDTITFTCKVIYSGAGTANDLPTCTLGAPGTLALSSAAPNGTLTATIVTIAPSGGAGVFRAQTAGGVSVVKAGFASLFGLLSLVLLPSGVRARRNGLFICWGVTGLLLAGLAGSAIGCGGGGSGGGSTSAPIAPIIPGTTAGSYLVTVVGASRTYTSVASFNLTVQ